MSSIRDITGMVRSKVVRYRTDRRVSEGLRNKYGLTEYPVGARNVSKIDKEIRGRLRKNDVKGALDYAKDQGAKVYQEQKKARENIKKVPRY